MWNSERHLIGYSAGNFGKNLVLGSVDVTLLFLLTDLLGVAAASVSTLMLMVLAADLVLDLGAGLLASWVQRRGVGYRRMIAYGAPPCAIAFMLLFSLAQLRVHDSVAIALVIILFRAFYAIIDVPHNSLLARVATDSRARGRAAGYRTVFSSLASILIATVLVPFIGGGRHPGAGELSIAGVGGGLLFCAALWLAAWSSQEPGAAGAIAGRPRVALAILPRLDRLFGAIALIALITGFAMPVFARMMLYLATYVLHQPALAGTVLLALTLGQLAGAGLWIGLVRSRDKTVLLALSHGVAAIGIALFFAGGARPAWLIAAAAPTGIGLGGVFMLPWGILADVLDFIEFRHGERRETAAFATILVLFKAGGAASVACIGWALALLGYVPGAAQPGMVIDGMRALAFGVPVAGALLAMLILRRLAVGHHVHARVVRANRLRRARVAA